MPGVPSGRACEACRRLKKKCDESQPKCSRCVRLNLECVGSGQRRFKFQYHDKSIPPLDRERSGTGSPKSSESSSVTLTLSRTPDVASGSLKSALIKTMLPTTDVRFNLAYSYGDFMETVPQRLGINIALDSAVEVLVAAHADVCSGSRLIRTRTISLHSQALHNLRKCLNDPTLAHTIETLGAVLVLLILQVFVGADENYWSQHYVGAAQILKARNYRHDPNDEFETILLATLRGPVLMEAILSGRLEFTPKEWRRLMAQSNPKQTRGEQAMQSVSLIPDLLHRRRQLHDSTDLQELQMETRQHYENLKAIMNRIKSRLEDHRKVSITSTSAIIGLPTEYALERQYAFSIFFAVTLNLVLRSFETCDADVLADGEHFADEIIKIAREAVPYKPLGSMYVSLCLAAVYTITADTEKQAIITHAYRDFIDGFPWANDLEAGMWDCSLQAGLRLPGLEIPDILQRQNPSG